MNKKQLLFTLITALCVGWAIYDPVGFMASAAGVMLVVVVVVIVVALIAVFSQTYISLGDS